MLKYIRGLVLCLVVAIELAYVPPTYAASADIMITHIQAGGVGAALEELVVIYNNSSEDVDVSDWCLKNKSNLAFVCFQHEVGKSVYLPAYQYVTVASNNLATTANFYDFSYIYTPLNQSSGSIVGGSDSITLVAQNDEIVDSHYWTTSLLGGMLHQRSQSPTSPLTYLDTDQVTDWSVQYAVWIPDSGIEIRDGDPDICPNIDGYQLEIPEGLEMGNDGNCRDKLYPLRLWEIMPNAEGSDTGKEFIEIYNPNDHEIDLTRYELLVGQNLEKTFSFPMDARILPQSYISFSNIDIGFSLFNTSSRVQLKGDGEVLDESPAYDDPGENMAWAVIDGYWQYTAVPTPGSDNQVFGEVAETTGGKQEVTEGLKPCNEGQYRHPETNRCRNLTATASPTPCKDDQYRSEETNRCRTIANTSTQPAPCKEGQERNQETNRCRTIKAISTVDYGVLGASTSKDEDSGYLFLAIGGVVALAIAYGIWEWRYELGKLFRRLAGFVRIRK